MTQPTEQQTAVRELPIGTRVQWNTLTGTVVDPDDATCGQPFKGYRPPYEAVWMYLDLKHHDRQAGIIYSAGTGPAPKHGLWVATDSPDLTVLADADPDVCVETDVVACYRAPVRYSTFKTGQWVRVTYRQDGGVTTVQTGAVTVEAGSVRLGLATWVDWDDLELLEVLNEPDSGGLS